MVVFRRRRRKRDKTKYEFPNSRALKKQIVSAVLVFLALSAAAAVVFTILTGVQMGIRSVIPFGTESALQQWRGIARGIHFSYISITFIVSAIIVAFIIPDTDVEVFTEDQRKFKGSVKKSKFKRVIKWQIILSVLFLLVLTAISRFVISDGADANIIRILLFNAWRGSFVALPPLYIFTTWLALESKLWPFR